MTDSMDPTFADGLRELLVRRVEEAPRRRRLGRWRWGVGLVLAAGLLGGGTALAAGLGVLPGADEHVELSAPVAVTEVGTATIDLGPRPKGASQVQLTLNPLDAGTYALGRGGASVTVPPSQAAAARSSDPSVPSAVTTAYLELFQLDESGTSFTITTSSPTLRWTAVLIWVSKHTTEWATNASGQTYGVLNDKGAPDLIAVTATNGRDGYVFRKDLDDADGTTASRSFTSPQDALDWQKAHQGKHVYIPVYESDGTTKIGVFQAYGS